MDTTKLKQDLKNALAKWNDLGPSATVDEDTSHHFMDLLVASFLECPLGSLDEIIDLAVEHANYTKKSMESIYDASSAEFQNITKAIIKDPGMQNDPSVRIKRLEEGLLTSVGIGNLDLLALQLEYIGDAEMQLERFMEASIVYRRAILINKKLGLLDRLPGLHLHTGQAFRYVSVSGKLTWDAPLSYFDQCLDLLPAAGLTEQAQRVIKAACFIDRAPCYAEIERDRYERGVCNLDDVIEGIRRGKQSTQEGIALAKEQPQLDGFIRQGEINLLRFAEFERNLA
jgi:hypothetical protein